MKQQRLDGLADGIFAIVMTLLVFEMKVPIFPGGNPTDVMLVDSLTETWNIFMSLVLSFALLFTYWRAHHFIASVYAKNLTVGLANINAIFFFFITLVPFVAHFLGEYPHSQIAVTLYGVTVIAIGLALFYMRIYVERNPAIETAVITKADRRSGYIRILFPVFSAAVAILISYWDTYVSMFLFTIAIMFNLLPASSNIIHRWLDLMFSDDHEIVKGNFTSSMPDMLKNEEYICVPKSAVFDHHRFRENEASARMMEAMKAGAVSQAGKKAKSKRSAGAKTASSLSSEVASSVKKPSMKKESKLDKVLEREIEEERKDGSVEDVIVKAEE
jgi:uncharacterized membrane protein